MSWKDRDSAAISGAVMACHGLLSVGAVLDAAVLLSMGLHWLRI